MEECVSVAGGEVPVFALGGIDALVLHEGGHEDHAVFVEEGEEVFGDGFGVGGVFEYFNADDEVELAGGAGGEGRVEGFEDGDIGEAERVEELGGCAAAAAVVEDAEVSPGEGFGDEVGGASGAVFDVIAVEADVVVVVDVLGEVGLGPGVEEGGEDEGASGAAVEQDGDADG